LAFCSLRSLILANHFLPVNWALGIRTTLPLFFLQMYQRVIMSKNQRKKNKKSHKKDVLKEKRKQIKKAQFVNNIKALKFMFRSKIALGEGDDEVITNKIEQFLSEMDQMHLTDLRRSIADFSYELNQVGDSVIPYFVLIFSRKLETLKCKKTYDDVYLDEKVDFDKYESLMKNSMINYTGNKFRLKDYKLPKMTQSEEQTLYCTSRKILDFHSLEKIDDYDVDADLISRSFSLAISRVLAKKNSCSYEFYYQFSAFLQRLNRDGYGQQARDFSEESLVCAEEDENISFGYYCKFSLYVDQKNILDSLIYGCMLLTNLTEQAEVNIGILKGTLLSAFKFYRESGFYSLGLNIYQYISQNFDLNEFEKQQIDTAMLYLVLVSEGNKVVELADKYLKENKTSIINWKESSQIPWLSLLSNIRHHFPVEYSNSKELTDFYQLIKSDISTSDLEYIECQFAINNADSKSYLKTALKKFSYTRNSKDYISEIEQLSFTSGAVLNSAISNKDIEGVLLAHKIRSDGSINFKSTELLATKNIAPLSFHITEYNESVIDNYISHIQSFLENHKDTQFVWLGFDNSGKAYCVVYKNKEFKYCDYLDSIILSDINNWLTSNISELGFDDSPKTNGHLETREDIWAIESKRIQSNLLKINIPVDTDEIVIFTDLKFSPYPHNLITNIDGEILVSESPVSSPLSLNNFIQRDTHKINVDKISVWAPISEGDYPIAIAYSKIQDELKNHQVVYSEGIKPDINKLSNINAFISHGGRSGLEGFKGLYPTDGKAYLDYGKVFGTGDVALLFVCHSGSVVKNNFSNSCHSLIKELLANGYRTVIAPSWSLNVCIPGVWTKHFINSMKTGYTVSRSAFIANKNIQKIYPVESAWAAMHVFGNPELTNA
jgi:hypothetical protein